MWCSEAHRKAGTRTSGAQTRTEPTAGVNGRREPTYRLIPGGTTGSKGPEAVKLASSAGIRLDAWQEDTLIDGMGVSGDRWSSDDVVILVSRQNGKSLVLVIRAVWGAAVAGETVLFSSHQYKAASESFLLAKQICETPAFARFKPKVRAAHGAEGIEFNSGGRLLFIARSRVSGRGFSPDTVIADEAFELSDLALSALRPALAAAKTPQTWFASSAPHDTSTVLRRLAIKGRAGEADRMTYLEWVADASLASSDVQAWIQSNPALGSRIDLATIASELDIMTPEDFARERLGIWREEDVGGVFDGALWASLANMTVVPNGSRRALAIDISPARDRSAIAAAADVGEGKVLVEVIRAERGTDWIVDEVARIVAKHSPGKVVIDSAGQSQSLFPKLRAADINVTATDTAAMADACAGFFDGVVQGKVLHRDDPALNQAVAGAKQRQLGDKWAWGRRTSRSDVSPLVACTLAHYAVATLMERKVYVMF